MTTPSELHRSAFVADAHNDLLMCVAARTPDRWAPYFSDSWLPQLQGGGVNLQVLPVYVSDRMSQDAALRQVLLTLSAAHRIVDELPDSVALCTESAHLDPVAGDERIRFLLAIEGLSCIGHDLALLGTLHRLGVRMASLTHLHATVLADGSVEDEARGGLSSGGREAVREMERVGIVVDVSHLSHRGVDDVLEVATRPIIASHSGAYTMRAHHRNLRDAHLDAIAAGGGVVALNCFAPYVHETEYTVERLCDHLEYLVERIGADHVGLGPDFMQQLLAELTPPARESHLVGGVDIRCTIPGLEGPLGLPLITEELGRRGWAEGDIRAVLGESIRGFLRRELVPTAPPRTA